MDSLKLKEGKSDNYFKALKELLGGEFSENKYVFNKGKTNILARAYSIHPDFEVIVTDAITDFSVVQDKIADDDPDQIYFSLATKGKMIQYYEDEEKVIEADTPNGIFFYNALFPIKTEYPANTHFNIVWFSTTRTFVKKLMPEATSIINSLFGDDTPVTYHSEMPNELEAKIKDIFYFKEGVFGKNSMVWAKSLELFTLLMQSIEQLNKEEKLYGLHLDDYERLLKMKQELMSDLEGKLVVEKLASDYGISLSKLRRDFKAMFNTSVYQFYTQAKMDEAYRRLKSGKYSVMEVGYDLGYNNLSKFSQMFKKVKGINPSDVVAL